MMRNRAVWLVSIAVLVQLLILAAVPARNAYTMMTGRIVVLKVAPVDPYSIMSGYYVALNYEISRPKDLDGGRYASGEPIYVVLAQGSDGCWAAESVHAQFPQVSPEKVVIRGEEGSYGRVNYGIESYYVPESVCDTINRDLREHLDQSRVEIKVDRFGHAWVSKLMIGDRVYDY